MKTKFAELKKYVTPYFKKWNSSGQMTADVAEKSITDFLRPTGSTRKDRHPKEKLIKYVHLLLKGDEDMKGSFPHSRRTAAFPRWIRWPTIALR